MGDWLGVTTDGYAVEGGFNGPGEPANQWVQWERAGLVAPSGRSCDFWRHPEVLLDRAASVGADTFGLTVEWARIEPEEGRMDAAALDRYAEILDQCAARRLAPVVTLHHRTHPWWLGEEFWLTPGSPDRFAAHVGRVVERLGDRCRRWVTLCEPNLVAAQGWVLAAEPPARLGALSDAWAVADNLMTAHVLAYEAVHGARADAEVTMAPRASSVYDLHQLWVDLLCARQLGVAAGGLDRWLAGRRVEHDRAVPPAGWTEAALRALVTATSPFGQGRGAGTVVGRSLRRPCPRRAVTALFAGAHPLPLDAVAVWWQQPVPTRLYRAPRRRSPEGNRRVGHGPTASWVRPAWDVPPDLDGLRGWCRRQGAAMTGMPRWVIDGGLATGNGGRGDGWDRPRYLEAQMEAVRAAGVTGYLYHSVADGYEPDGAHYGIDDEAAATFRALVAGCRS